MDKKPYEWDKMWGVPADPQEMFIAALFHRKPKALADLIAIGPEDEPRLKAWAADLLIDIDDAQWFIPKARGGLASSEPPIWREAFHFEYDAWDERWTPKAEYVTAIRAAFEQQLAAYTRRDADPARMPPTEMREPQHFLWAVAYFIDRKTTSEIADEIAKSAKSGKMSQQNVDVAVRDVANMIGLKMRNRGRPKKSTTKNTNQDVGR